MNDGNVLIISCEHGGNRIPATYRQYFSDTRHILESHEGYDIGALDVARTVAGQTGATLFFSEVSRLVFDLNRSPGHPRLFSGYTRNLPQSKKDNIMNEYYHPYRKRVLDRISSAIDEGKPVLHISVHSFTPVFNGIKRDADVGLLYNPERHREKQFCRELKKHLTGMMSGLRVRMNYPYRGTSDGLTTYIRKQYPNTQYAGVELEINQALLLMAIKAPVICNILSESILTILDNK